MGHRGHSSARSKEIPPTTMLEEAETKAEQLCKSAPALQPSVVRNGALVDLLPVVASVATVTIPAKTNLVPLRDFVRAARYRRHILKPMPSAADMLADALASLRGNFRAAVERHMMNDLGPVSETVEICVDHAGVLAGLLLGFDAEVRCDAARLVSRANGNELDAPAAIDQLCEQAPSPAIGAVER